MLEICQNDQNFWEVRVGEHIYYTCLKEEDALDYQKRHQIAPPPSPKHFSQNEMERYALKTPGVSYRSRYQEGHDYIDIHNENSHVRETWICRGFHGYELVSTEEL